MIDILMLIISLVESTDQTIIQIIRENKSVLMLLINPSNCFTGCISLHGNIPLNGNSVCILFISWERTETFKN